MVKPSKKSQTDKPSSATADVQKVDQKPLKQASQQRKSPHATIAAAQQVAKPDTAVSVAPAAPAAGAPPVPQSKKRKSKDELDDIFSKKPAVAAAGEASPAAPAAAVATAAAAAPPPPSLGKLAGSKDDIFGAAAAAGGRSRTVEGFVIYSEAELGLDRRNAGNTDLCPFDCECCF